MLYNHLIKRLFNRLFKGCALAFGLLTIACQTDNPLNTVELHTINGSEVPQGSPFEKLAVAFITAYGDAFCSGSLIGRQTVLTAGHCFVPESAYNFDEIFVYFGTDVANVQHLSNPITLYGETKYRVDPSDPRVRKIAHVHLHENFSQLSLMWGNPALAPAGEKWAWQSMGSDVAIVKLGVPAPVDYESVKVVKNRDYLLVGGETVTLGFGRGETIEGKTFEPGRLHQVETKIEEVKSTFGEFLVHGEKGRQAFHGDSGGPVLVKTAEGWQQIGLVSHPAISESSGAEEAKARVIYTSTQDYLDWINLGANSYYCTDFVISDKIRECEEGDVACDDGSQGVAFEGSPTRFDPRRIIWRRFQPGQKLRRLIKANYQSGFVAEVDSEMAEFWLPKGQTKTIGFVNNFFLIPLQGQGCRN